MAMDASPTDYCKRTRRTSYSSSCSSVSCGTENRRTRTGKTVAFASRPEVNVFYKVPSAESLWWGAGHVRNNKDQAVEDGKMWREKGYDILLKDVFRNPRGGDREKLDTFVQLPGDDYMRGLENYLCPSLALERRKARHLQVQTIVDMEIALKVALDPKTDEQIAETLAALARDLSSQARDYAKRVGTADELGEKLGENPELPHYILREASMSSKNEAGRAFSQGNKVSAQTAVGSSSFGRLVSSVATAMGA